MGQQISETPGKKSIDPDLKIVVEKWIDLTPTQRAELKEMVKTASDQNGHKD